MFYFIYSVIDLTEKVGPLELPANQTGSIEVTNLYLTGEMGLWGKSLILKDNYSPRTICASITVLYQYTHTHTCINTYIYVQITQ